MHRRGKEKRNVIVFGLILAVLAGLIALAGVLNRRPQRIMPAESPEIAAKRQSSDNAYYTLEEAVALLPEEPLPLTEQGASLTWYEPEPGSIGKLLRIRRPDDDPDLLAYLEQCEPAIEKAREAVGKPYYLLPDVGNCPAPRRKSLPPSSP